MFPLAELPAPVVEMTAEWTLAQLVGYLRTWSAVRDYQKAEGTDPVAALAERLLSAWGAPETPRTVCWPLTLRMFRLA